MIILRNCGIGLKNLSKRAIWFIIMKVEYKNYKVSWLRYKIKEIEIWYWYKG